MDGQILGRHKGITHYTIGQRKGLGIAFGHPVFVVEIRPETNEVVLGEGEDVFHDRLTCNQVNWMAVAPPPVGEDMRMLVKIRYAHQGAMATLRRTGEDQVTVLFDTPQRAITPGQAAVFYDGDYVAGGGTIQ